MRLFNTFPHRASLLCFVALAFLFSGKKVFVNEEYFSLKESKELNKVLLYTGNLPSGSFYKQADNSWQLNENIQVDKKMSALLMTVLKDVKIRKRVEKEEKEKVRQYLKKKGFVVEYYYHDLLNKAIYFASSEDKPGYTYAMTEEDEEPFVVYIPKARLKIEELFSKPDYQWRDQTLFNSEYKNIEFVSVEYQNQKDSFEISKTGNEILLNGKIPSSVEQIQRYLGSFNSIEASAHLTNNEILLDSLRLSKPYCVIKVADKTFENKRSLNIYLCDQNSQIVYGQLDHQKEAYIIPIENIRSLMLKKGDLIKKAS